jgi:hypothetical protein
VLQTRPPLHYMGLWLWPLSLTLTFKQPIWVLFVTHCLYVFDISAMLFENPLRNDRDSERTRPPVQYRGLRLWPLSVTRSTWPSSNGPGSCLSHVVFMCLTFLACYFKKWRSYWADTTTIAVQCIMTLISKCDLDLRATWVLCATRRLNVFDISAKLF